MRKGYLAGHNTKNTNTKWQSWGIRGMREPKEVVTVVADHESVTEAMKHIVSIIARLVFRERLHIRKKIDIVKKN